MNIAYGICGDGRGHFGRSYALIEKLRSRGHEVDVFTFGDAYKMFQKVDYPEDKLHEIEGLRFGKGARGISLTGTIKNYFSYIWNRKKSRDRILKITKQKKTKLFLTDFEPLVVQVSKQRNIPCVSIDNQHKFRTPLRDGFPLFLQFYNWLAGTFVCWHIGKPNKSIVNTFHECLHRRGFERVEVMLREFIEQSEPTNGDHVLVYLHQCSDSINKITPTLSQVHEKFIVYGLESQQRTANIEYKETSYHGFVEDLKNSKAVICTAGNQLIGECKFFGKKVLAIPVPWQSEQTINARYVKKEGIGEWCETKNLTTQVVENFLNTEYEKKPGKNGVYEILALLEEYNV